MDTLDIALTLPRSLDYIDILYKESPPYCIECWLSLPKVIYNIIIM